MELFSLLYKFISFFARSTSPDFWPYSFKFVYTLISSDYTITTFSQLGSSGGKSSGLGLGMGVCFRLLGPILFSISPTLALTDVGETFDTLPVVPLELPPPVSTGSSNNTLFLSSAVKVHVVPLVNSGLSSSSFHSPRVGSLRPIHLLRDYPTKSLDSRFGGLRFCHPLNLRVSSGVKLQKAIN